MSADDWMNDLLIYDGDRLIVRLLPRTNTCGNLIWCEYEPEFVAIDRNEFLAIIARPLPENVSWMITYAPGIKGIPIRHYVLFWAPDVGRIRMQYIGPLLER